jgi:hypothetical protein
VAAERLATLPSSAVLPLAHPHSTGQYEDHSGSDGLNPLPYDTFPDKYMTVMCAQVSTLASSSRRSP